MKKKYYIHYPEFYPAMEKRISFDMALYCNEIELINKKEYEQLKSENYTTEYDRNYHKFQCGFYNENPLYYEPFKDDGFFHIGNGNYRKHFSR